MAKNKDRYSVDSYDEYDEYAEYEDYDKYGDDDERHFSKPYKKKHRKGHQSKHGRRNDCDMWDYLLNNEDEGEEVSGRNYRDRPSAPRSEYPTKTSSSSAVPSTISPTKPTIDFGPNSYDFRTTKIDLDRVSSMEKVDGEYKGHPSYGIAFGFGKPGSGKGRTVWYGWDVSSRDADWETYYPKWQECQQRRKEALAARRFH